MDRKQEFVRRADAIIKKIEALLEEDYENRSEKIIDLDLQDMIRLIMERKEMVEANQLPPKSKRYRSLTHIIVDQWPLASPLGDEVIELEKYYLSL